MRCPLPWSSSKNYVCSTSPATGSLNCRLLCAALEQLLLGCNALHQLAPTLGQLVSLTRLDISANRLLGVGPWIKQLVNLQELDLSSNRMFASETLTYVCPPTMARLRLAHIKLGAVPLHVWKFTALTELSVAHASMRQLAPKVKSPCACAKRLTYLAVVNAFTHTLCL